MLRLHLSVSGIVCLLIFSGCAGLMSSELRDAETLKKGEGEGSVRLMMVADAAALLRDSLFDGGAEIVAPALGAGGSIGITDRLELNGSAWTSALFTAPVSFFRTLDIGVRGGARFRVTPRPWQHNLAVGLNAWWHGGMNLTVRFDDDLRYYGTAWGVDPSLVWSWRLSDDTTKGGVRSIYAGGSIRFAQVDYTYGYSGGDSTASVTTRRYHGSLSGVVPCLGIRTSTDFFIEVGAMILKHPESHSTHWIPSLGIGWKAGD